MNKTITVFLNVRKNSQRCFNKLLRSFSDTCLFEIALKKLGQLKCDAVCLSAYDEEFFEFSRKKHIQLYRRSLNSVTIDGPMIEVYECYKECNTNYVMFLNPCHAMLKVSTIQNAINVFKNSNHISMTSVEKTNDWILDKNANLLAPSSIASGETKSTDAIFRIAHAFHIYPKQRFLDSGTIWSHIKDDPNLFEISSLESLDVDDQDDFLISEAVFEASRK